MDYHKILIEKLTLTLAGEITIADLVCWVNQIYEQFFNSKEYESVKYRLINNILIELKDLDDDLDNVNSINDEEQEYVSELLQKELSYLNGEERYFETYKIRLNNFERFNVFKPIIEDSIRLVLSQNELSVQAMESLKKLISRDSCITINDILLNEVVDSILMINDANASVDQMVSIGTLGKSVGLHTVSDEGEYLIKLYSALKGDNPIRFSLAFNSESILYTNIFVLSN